MKVIIHINRQIIGRNAKSGANDPAIIVRTYKGVKHTHEVKFCCPQCKKEVARLVQPGHTGCGAKIWINSTDEVISEEL
jgi:hypothetical protein